MELFGININFNGKKNPVVRQQECHQAQDTIRAEIKSVKDHIDTRIEDLKDFLLKNGR